MSTYPPETHVLRDLRITMERPRPGFAICSCPIVPGICTGSADQPRIGVIATLIDMAGAATAIGSVAPDWIATLDLSLTLGNPFSSTGPIVVTAETLRAGSNVVVVRTEIGDGRGRDDPALMTSAGIGLMKFARIPGEASLARGKVQPTSLKTENFGPDNFVRGSIFHQIGIRVVDAEDGIVELDKTDYVRNSFGSVNGGVLALVAEAAAGAIVDDECEPVDLQIHYLAQTKAGPVRTKARLIRDELSSQAVEVAMYDVGNSDLPLAIATVMLTVR